jgi:hypothetical protein
LHASATVRNRSAVVMWFSFRLIAEDRMWSPVVAGEGWIGIAV